MFSYSSIAKATAFLSLFLTAFCKTNAQPSSAGNWTQISSGSPGGVGIYGSLGAPASGNLPGGRNQAETWVDSQGQFWLFGGEGLDQIGTPGELNDLWKYDSSANLWTWIGGSSTVGANCAAGSVCGQPGVYGVLGQAAAVNIPGGRRGAVSWVDDKGLLWLFGGFGFDANHNAGELNDLWQYNPSTNLWTWMGGSSSLASTCAGAAPCGHPGVYGSIGTPQATNIPGGRESAITWTDSSGSFWMYGGSGFDSTQTQGVLNDLWQFTPSTGMWTWRAGSQTLSCSPGVCGENPVFGTLGVPDAANTPGGRFSSTSWIDSSGKLWLFGGFNSYLPTGSSGPELVNDLWQFDPTSGDWTLISPGTAAIASLPIWIGGGPGYRSAANGWTDATGNFWLVAGSGVSFPQRNDSLYNDVWVFNPPTVNWQWVVGGCSDPAEGGGEVCSTTGTGASFPNYRSGAASWVDRSGDFWTFGGDTTANDLWVYQPPTSTLFPPALPGFSPAPGTYTNPQAVAISEATAGATVYYTTDGTLPTTASAVYSSPLQVSSTETIAAMSVQLGHPNGNIVKATYTIPPDFSLGAAPSSLSVTAGQSATTTISVTPINGFAGSVAFECSSGLPPGASCSFAPATVTPTGAAASTTLTISTARQTASTSGRLFPSALILTSLLFLFGGKNVRRRQVLLLLALLCVGTGSLIGCSGGGESSHPPVTATVTVDASAGTGAGTPDHKITTTLAIN